MVARTEQPIEPLIEFMPTQRRLFEDDSRLIVANCHRQWGKDFVAAGKAVNDASVKRMNWYIISLTQRQADATFRKVKDFATMFKEAFKLVGSIEESETDTVYQDKELDHLFKFKSREVIMPNGSRIVALPGRDPDACAGETGNIILTEFGLFPKGGYEHWGTLQPITTRGGRMIVISTPRGKNHKFYELCTTPDIASYHKCDIVQNLKDGFVLKDHKRRPCTLETFKKQYGDPTRFKREYMCEFSGDLDTLIRLTMLEAACGNPIDFDLLQIANDSNWNPNFFNCDIPHGCRLEIGWDVARKHDLSVVFVNLALPDGRKMLRKLLIMRNCSFELQRKVVRAAMGQSPANVGCGDATGMGMDSNETLTAEYGDRWVGVPFTQTTKGEMGSLMFSRFSEGSQLLPSIREEATKFIAYDFYAIQKEEREDRKLVLSETPNPLCDDSHCDIAYAGALAMRAGGIQAFEPGVIHI